MTLPIQAPYGMLILRTQRGRFIEGHTEQIMPFANLEHLDQIWDHAAIRIFSHDDRFAGCEPGHIAIPGRLTIACVAHFRDDEINLRLHWIIPMSHQVEEVARDQHGPSFLGSILADVVCQLAEVASNLARLIAVIFPKERCCLTIRLEVEALCQQPFTIMEGFEVDSP